MGQKEIDKKERIVIVGAGQVGVNTALMLNTLYPNKEVILVEEKSNILQGSSLDAFILHTTGFEYMKDGHQETGYDCIKGGMLKALMMPIPIGKRMNFLLSDATAKELRAAGPGPELFFENAKTMKKYYRECYEQVRKEFGWSEIEAEAKLTYTPETFGQEIENMKEEIPGATNIERGLRSAGGTVFMGIDYAIKKQALEKAKSVTTKLNTEVTSVTQKNVNNYTVTTNDGEEMQADMVVFATGHQNSHLVGAVAETDRTENPQTKGTYYLNATSHVVLPPLKETRERLKEKGYSPEEIETKISEIKYTTEKAYFTLQQENGCMFAPLMEATEDQPGLAAVYFPSLKKLGSQLAMHDTSNGPSPDNWRQWERDGYPDEKRKEHVESIAAQLYKLYPALKDYIDTSKENFHFIPRTVFNPDGHERRVRTLQPPHDITKDGKVIMAHAPKWTNAEMAAWGVVNAIDLQLRLEHPALEKSSHFGERMKRFTESVNWNDIKPDPSKVREYYASPALGYSQPLIERLVSKAMEAMEELRYEPVEPPRKARKLGPKWVEKASSPTPPSSLLTR